MAQASGGNEQDDFNSGMIQSSLLQQLRKILDRYPDDNQIIKVGVSLVRLRTVHTRKLSFTC